MADKTRQVVKQITLEIDGEAYELRLDLTAMKDFEDATGRTVLQVVKPIFTALRPQAIDNPEATVDAADEYSVIERIIDSNAVSAGDLQCLLWACMGGPDCSMTLRQAGRLIHTGNVAEVAQTLWTAISAAMFAPVAEDEEPAGDEDPKN